MEKIRFAEVERERTFHARLRQIVSSPTCLYLPQFDQRTQLTNERFDPTYPFNARGLIQLSSFFSMFITVHYGFTLTELGSMGNRIYRMSSFHSSASCRPRSASYEFLRGLVM
ncbi:hypothetical protein T11_15921 [Trichinella zimbabwensis]|uniref:Uncharacterized protein n=1 Tax=Trichinella zimbabwensis TaxID=268475 RepID=A0A0V1HQ33_9BILA|nr:hypothetical protein T11_15921 [Trichinella zimbabwensis]